MSSAITRPAFAAIAFALLSGCVSHHRDSITVGAIPDDYRTNHPIVIGEKEEILDIPVGTGDRGMTQAQKASLEGFLSNYDRRAASTLTILTPHGAVNALAASHAAADFAKLARANGVPASRIVIASYEVDAADAPGPVRVTYLAMRAQTNKCGRWPADLANTGDNKHYANFGCSYQNNLAAQVANPADLLGPRKQTTIDAENRNAVIDLYRDRGVSEEFLGNSEVDYDS